MSEKIEPIRFSRAGFRAHFEPWIRENGEPGDFYLVFRDQPVTMALLNDVIEHGYPIGSLWRLTIREVFENYRRFAPKEGRQT